MGHYDTFYEAQEEEQKKIRMAKGEKALDYARKALIEYGSLNDDQITRHLKDACAHLLIFARSGNIL